MEATQERKVKIVGGRALWVPAKAHTPAPSNRGAKADPIEEPEPPYERSTPTQRLRESVAKVPRMAPILRPDPEPGKFRHFTADYSVHPPTPTGNASPGLEWEVVVVAPADDDPRILRVVARFYGCNPSTAREGADMFMGACNIARGLWMASVGSLAEAGQFVAHACRGRA